MGAKDGWVQEELLLRERVEEGVVVVGVVGVAVAMEWELVMVTEVE